MDLSFLTALPGYTTNAWARNEVTLWCRDCGTNTKHLKIGYQEGLFAHKKEWSKKKQRKMGALLNVTPFAPTLYGNSAYCANNNCHRISYYGGAYSKKINDNRPAAYYTPQNYTRVTPKPVYYNLAWSF